MATISGREYLGIIDELSWLGLGPGNRRGPELLPPHSIRPGPVGQKDETVYDRPV